LRSLQAVDVDIGYIHVDGLQAAQFDPLRLRELVGRMVLDLVENDYGVRGNRALSNEPEDGEYISRKIHA